MTAHINTQNDRLNILRVNTTLNRQKEKLSLELGELISATITSQSKGKTLLTTKNDICFEADSANIKGNVGDELLFEVVKAKDTELVLKQLTGNGLESGQTIMKLKSAADLKELFKQNNLLSDEKLFKDSKTRNEELENERKTAQALAKIRRQITYATDTTNVNAVGELVASGVSLSKINLPVLNSVIKEINVKPHLKPSAAQNRAAREESALASSPGKLLTDEVLSNEAVMDVNNQDDNTHEKYAEAINLSENEIINIIKDEKELTLENIYVSKHAVPDSAARQRGKQESLSEKTLNELEPEINRVLENNDLPLTEENLKTSKKLISRDVALTKKNISQFYFLKNLSTSQLESIFGSSVDKNAARSKNTSDINPATNFMNINLFEIHEEKSREALYKNYEDIIKSFPHIGSANINLLFKRKEPITLNNLKNTVNIDNPEIPASMDDSDNVIKVKRQLAEIRLKLTHEAALRLASKNISIDTSPLSEALKVLRNQELESYSSSLRAMETPATAENISAMKGLYEKIPSFSNVSTNALTNVVGSVAHDGLKLNVTTTYNGIEAANISGLYERNTNPAKISTPFSDLQQQLSNHLEGIGLNSSEKNLKAAKILFNNKLEINEESISRVKLIEAKIDRLYNTLHPNIAASMIKDGLNPLEMHIDEMLEYVDKFNDIYGQNLGDKIALFISQMDNNSSYTDEERQGVIAIYKMINTMLNHGGAGLGQIVKNKTPMNMGSMMESAKLYRNTVIKNRKYDFNIIDGESIRTSANSLTSIRKAIEKAVSQAKSIMDETDKKRIASLLDENNMAETLDNIYMAEANSGENLSETAYAALNLKNIAEMSSPNYLRKLIKENPEALNLDTDSFLEFLKEESKNNAPELARLQEDLVLSYTEQLRNLSNTEPQIIHWMSQNNIESNIASILLMQEMIKDPFCLSKRMDSLSKTLKESDKEKDSSDLSEIYDDISIDGDIYDTGLRGLENTDDITNKLENIDHKLRLISADPHTSQFIEKLNSAQSAIKLQNQIASSLNGRGYHIPLKLHDKISGLNMYYLNNSNQADDLLLSLDTNSLGTVQIYAHNTDSKLTLTVSSQQEEAVFYLRENAEALLKYVKESGFGSEQIEIIFDSKAPVNMLESVVLNNSVEH